jgi:hypothetical protein
MVRAALRQAIHDAYHHEWQLFGERANERSLLFHIGRYLATQVHAWNARLSVDVEYNRHHVNGAQIGAPKRLPRSFELCDHCRNRGRRGRVVCPDLIVHDRSGSSEEHNLLVVEAKHGSSRCACDEAKLRALVAHFDYRYAVFVKFPAEGQPPLWQWITNDDAYTAEGLSPVFQCGPCSRGHRYLREYGQASE